MIALRRGITFSVWYNLGIYTTCQGNSAAFLPLKELTSASVSDTIINKLSAQNPNDLFPSGTDASIISGWKAQRDILVRYMRQDKIAVGELAGGSAAGGALALVKPFSRGFLTLNSTDPFDNPLVDYATLRNPLDLDIIIEIIRTWRKLLKTPSLQTLSPVAISPADNLTSNADLTAYIRENLMPSFSHPSGSAPMMKRELGGVVGSDLLVYGAKKLSIIDASILPVVPSTHTTTTVYAVAEKVRSP